MINKENIEEKIKFENGKYTFYVLKNDFKVRCHCRGESWVVFQEGSKTLIELLKDYDKLKTENKILNEERKKHDEYFSQVRKTCVNIVNMCYEII